MSRPTLGTLADLDAWIARAAANGDDDPTIGSISARDRLAAHLAATAALRDRAPRSLRTTHLPHPRSTP